MACTSCVLKWALAALCPWTSTSPTTSLGGVEDAQGRHGNSTTHVGRNSRTIFGIVSNEYKSPASTPLKKHILQKKKSGSKEFYKRSQLEEKAGPSGFAQQNVMSEQKNHEWNPDAQCPAQLSPTITQTFTLLCVCTDSFLTCNAGPSHIVCNILIFQVSSKSTSPIKTFLTSKS